ncbi:MAG: hypothetical protein GY787_15340, partial [Alteromonadales bacterium]|nr:hypothetical protein [Alteromonadales bacterium]
MITSMITPMITPMVTSMFGDDGATTRYFTLLDSVLNNYWEFASTLTHQSGDTFEFEFLAPTAASANTAYLLDNSTSSDRSYLYLRDGFYIFNGASMVLTIDGVATVSGESHATDGKLHKAKITYTALAKVALLGGRYTLDSFYDGILANPVSTISGSTQTFTLGNSYEQGDTEYSAENTFGSELVVNGDFETDSDWTKENGTTIVGGELVLNTSATYATLASQAVSFSTDTAFMLEITVSGYVSGAINVRQGTSGSNNILEVTGDGTYYALFTGVNSSPLTIRSGGGSTQANINNISIREVQGNAITRYLVPSTNIEQYTLTDGVWVGDDTFDPSSASAYGESTILSSNDYDIISSSGVNSGINFVD